MEREMSTIKLFWMSVATTTALMSAPLANAGEGQIVHDVEFELLKMQNGESWATEDVEIAQKLADIREKNNGAPPNIIYILLDDVGFGEIGMPDLRVIRGYDTPAISQFASEGMSLLRMYTEPSCTPTRVAMMTGRLPVRTGLVDAKATIAGEGIADAEVTVAEVLKEAGYNTSHIGKWHMGDISQSWPHNQGFDHAEFPIHQQAQLALFSIDAQREDVTRGLDLDNSVDTYTLDKFFSPNPADMVTGVEVRDGKVYEVDLEPGEAWTQAKYREMNERYQRSAMSELQRMAGEDEPFFLNYWPLFPLNFSINDVGDPKTLNAGTFAETIAEVDGWIGDLLDEVDTLGVAENTVIVIMGDNGPFMKYAGASGQSDRIYRGAKGDHLEGGVRVNAFVRWPSAIEANSSAMDIVHVSDLYATFAAISGASDAIPTDRVVDGIDQTSLLLNGDAHGRRDYVYIYEGTKLKSVVKNKYKMHLPPAGANPILFSYFFDLYRDPREDRPKDSIKLGTWAGGQFGLMIERHMAQRQALPDWPVTRAEPYEGIVNLRPETIRLMEYMAASEGQN